MTWGAVAGAAVGVVGSAITSDGGDSGGSTQQASTMTKQQKNALKQLLGTFTGEDTYNALTALPTDYQGTFTAPLSNLQNLSLSAIENMVKEMGSTGTYANYNKAMNEALSGKASDVSQTFQDSIVSPYLKQFQEQTMPGVIGNFAGMGAYGSDRQKQQQLAMQNLNDSVLSAGSALAYQADNAAKQRQAQVLSYNMPANNLIAALNAGKVSQDTAQNELTSKYTDYLNQQKQKNVLLEAFLQAVGIKGTENIVNAGGTGMSAEGLAGLGTATEQLWSKVFGDSTKMPAGSAGTSLGAGDVFGVSTTGIA